MTRSWVSIFGKIAAACGCIIALTANAAVPESGIWWNPAESGRGFIIETSGNEIFMGTFLYEDSDAGQLGRSTWYDAGGALNADGSFSGALTEHTGGQTLNGSYRSPTNHGSPSTVTLACTTTTSCALTWQGGTVQIQRFTFDSQATPTTAPEKGIWWNPAESGRGFVLEQQGNSLFAGGFMYDESGNPVWYSTSGPISGTSYQGDLLQFAGGQSMSGTYRSPSATNIGAINIVFQDQTHATLIFSEGTQVSIERFRFGTPVIPKITLSEVSDSFFEPSTLREVSWPYSVNATSQQTIIGSSSDIPIALYSLSTTGTAFTISELAAYDNNGKVSPYFSGLINGQRIAAGSTVAFSLKGIGNYKSTVL